ncbi:hypothetical protein Ancab_034199 [Ancistrocladus abbreviatus]
MAVLSCASLEISHHFPQLFTPGSTIRSSLFVSFRKQNRFRSKTVSFHAGWWRQMENRRKCGFWAENKEVMLAAVARGWNTLIFSSNRRKLAEDWASIAVINPLFVKEHELIDNESKRIATFFEIRSPQQLDQLLLMDDSLLENVIVNFLDWQVIPAENIVAAFQGTNKTLFGIAKTLAEAKSSLEALEQGLAGVVLKVEDVAAVLQLKDYFDRRNELRSDLPLTKATVTEVGSFARGLFLVHSECLDSNYVASRPFRINAGPVHSYVAIPNGKTCYLSELKAGKEVIVVDYIGQQRTAIVGRIKIETRPLILVEAEDISCHGSLYTVLLQNAETVAFVAPSEDHSSHGTAIPVSSLKVGDQIILRKQGGARHTGIEIQEFVLEK